MVSFTSFLSVLPLITPALAGYHHHIRSTPEEPHPYPHNPNHPHRQIAKKSITTNVQEVSGAAFDFIIAGGGCAGLALAVRLSEWSNVTVLLIEAGTDGSEFADEIAIPGYSYLNSLGGSSYSWQYQTTTQVDSNDRVMSWPRGKGLGGSGAINGLFWGRGASEEYDAWDTLNPDGEVKWNWQEMQKYINKAENFTEPPQATQDYFNLGFNPSAHGTTGPIQAGFSQYIFDGVKNWVPAWLNLGFTLRDLADGTINGPAFSASTLNPTNQSRSDSKAGYYDPLPPRSNLVVLTGQQVTSVIFNGGSDASGNVIASGVTFQAARGATQYSVQANREVIMAGGTVGTPQILQLSGIGPETRLQPLGINTRVDLPVGYNLQDHVSYSMYWSTPANTLTWGTLAADQNLRAQQLEIYRQNRTGMWTYINEAVGYTAMSDVMSAASATSYASAVQSALASTAADVTSWLNLPDTVSAGLTDQYRIQQQWLSGSVGQLEIILTMLGNAGNLDEVGIQVALQHPWSRGNIFINSTDPFTNPNINPDYFGVGYDVDIMNHGSLFARQLAATAPLTDLMVRESVPGASTTDDDLNEFIKNHAGTEYHPLGTCAMMPRNKGGVVDTNLIVYGTSNLRVIDASIMPMQISAHLMASTYGIAEKGADLIKQKYWAVQPDTTNTTSSADSAAETTASVGRATDTAVTSSDNQSGNSSSGSMSSGTKIGLGVGVGVGAAALLAALLAFFCLRRKRKSVPGKSGFYEPSPRDDVDASGAYKEAGNGSYPMAPFATSGLQSRSDSMDTMATAELASHKPMRSQSGYNMGDYDNGGEGPYRDHQPDASWPREQTYKKVQV